MHLSEEVTGTLRAQEHGYQPLVLAGGQGGAEIGDGVCPTITGAAGTSGNNQPILFDNHGKDCRYNGPLKVAPTVAATYGKGETMFRSCHSRLHSVSTVKTVIP